ncbi:universal stress protein [Streptomyces sp. NPDC003327]
MSRAVTVGIDGSREGLAAAEWAADEALIRDRLLRLVHVSSDDGDVGTRYAAPEAHSRRAEDLLHAAAQHVRSTRPDVRMETAHVRGDPVDALTSAGDAAELLVLGSRGLGGVTGFIAGSVSLAVLGRVSHPVVLVRVQEPEEREPARAVGDVVLGLDLPRAADDALAFAFGCADLHGCGLRVVHSWSLPPVYGTDTAGVLPVLMKEVAAERQRELEAALAPWVAKYPDIPVGRRCLQGRPAQDLVDAAREARLIVVGLRHRGSPVGAHVGPVIHAVLHHAGAPVAVVPHD